MMTQADLEVPFRLCHASVEVGSRLKLLVGHSQSE